MKTKEDEEEENEEEEKENEKNCKYPHRIGDASYHQLG